MIAERDAGSANIKIAAHADGHGLERRIEDVGRGIGDRPSDGHARAVDLLDDVADGEGRRLGRPVAIDEPLRLPALEHQPDAVSIRSFAAKHHVAQSNEHRGRLLRHLVEERSREEKRGNLVLREMLRERGGREQHLGWRDHECAAIEQRAPDLKRRGIEAKIGMLHRHDFPSIIAQMRA